MRILFIVFVAFLTGCWHWAKAGFNEVDFQRDQAQCKTIAAAQFPFIAIPPTPVPARNTNVNVYLPGMTPLDMALANSHQQAAQPTEYVDVYSSVFPPDANEGSRKTAFEACMMSRGYYKEQDKW